MVKIEALTTGIGVTFFVNREWSETEERGTLLVIIPTGRIETPRNEERRENMMTKSERRNKNKSTSKYTIRYRNNVESKRR